MSESKIEKFSGKFFSRWELAVECELHRLKCYEVLEESGTSAEDVKTVVTRSADAGKKELAWKNKLAYAVIAGAIKKLLQ